MPKFSRRRFFKTAMGIAGLSLTSSSYIPPFSMSSNRIPVIDITDLYHPPQDFGDTVDLIFPYAIPEIDLLGVLLDVSQRYRMKYMGEGEQGWYNDPTGGREPGVITVWQLNYLFDRAVPCAPCPFVPMARPTDPQTSRGVFENQGIQLFKSLLEQSSQPVDVVSFGSARPIAVAMNQFPDLLRKKVNRIHLCAGSYPPGKLLEWNVKLDPNAFVRVLSEDIPIYLYPCADKDNAFALGNYNTYWLMPNLEFMKEIDPRLLRYLIYSHSRSHRVDFLQVLEEEPSETDKNALFQRAHNVWETDVWLEVSKRLLVQRADGSYQIIPSTERKASDRIISPSFLPVRFKPFSDGNFEMEQTNQETPHRIFFRSDPEEHQKALREALPILYKSFRTVPKTF
ncbi:MAG TPA: hypothetical protein PLA12_04465 [Candidatus Hydrogenedens sp.]|nr:hypothetical protein [Candidatus Hydrogenedens sp.]